MGVDVYVCVWQLLKGCKSKKVVCYVSIVHSIIIYILDLILH